MAKNDTAARDLFRRARMRKHLTQTELGVLVDKDVMWVSHRETGRVAYSLDDARLLAEALDIRDSEWTRLRFQAVS